MFCKSFDSKHRARRHYALATFDYKVLVWFLTFAIFAGRAFVKFVKKKKDIGLILKSL